MTEKVVEKVSSNGRIVIPKEWRDILKIIDGNLVELELKDNKLVIIKKKIHPLEIEDNHPLKKIIGIFDDIKDFNDEEYEQAKISLFPKPNFENE